MGICFTHSTIKISPERQKLITHSHISRVMKLTSHGQYGAVREAEKIVKTVSASVGKTFAIKSILKSRMNVAMLRRELEIMAILDHPNIIRLYESYEDEQYVHIVMEYCGGGDIAERIINDGHFSELEASHIMEKLLGAVHYLHLHQISHRDLKAENFLYESTEPGSQIKIADFGMSSKFGVNMRMQSLAGTPYYLAPEILKGSYTKSCDIWSLGVFLYFILSGTHPFKGQDLEDVFDKLSAGKLKFDSKVWENISKNAIDLISKMLVVDPKSRISIKKALSHPWFTSHKSMLMEPVPFSIFNSLKAYKAQSKLWQEALKVIIRELSNEQIEELKKSFIAIDTNNSGSISASELAKAMKISGYLIAEEEIMEIIKNNTYLSEGKINYSDFLIATIDKKKLLDDEVLWQAFKFFDVDNDGIISFEDLKLAFQKCGIQFSDAEIDNQLITSQTQEFENANFEKFKGIINKKQMLNDLKNEEDFRSVKKLVKKITQDLQKTHS